MDEPPHNHASGQGGTAKVWLQTSEIEQHQGFKASDLKRIIEVATDHKDEFLEAWHEFFKSLSGQ